MITVELLHKEELLCGFVCSGHANRGEYGHDIVCSAVSAITQTCVLGICEVLNIDAAVRVDDVNGIDCRLSSETDTISWQKAALLLQTMRAGLAAVEDAYPGTLKIFDREV